MTLRRPSRIEIAGQLLLVAVFAMLAWDLFSALGAVPCSGSQSVSGCYPWGGTESPPADYWYYGSKMRYLASSALLLTVLIAAAWMPILAKRPAAGLVLMVSITVGGWLAIRYGMALLVN